MLAHAGTPDETVAELLIAAAAVVGWIAVSRLRGRGFGRMPILGAWALAAISAGAIAAAVLVPSMMRPSISSVRPHSTATLRIAAPRANAVVRSDRMEVDIELVGGRITPLASTNLTPDTGHLHVFVDGKLLSMGTTGATEVDISNVSDGEHLLEAEFVAVDHGPFDPPVTTSVPFDKES
jgi:hypothetical protein